MCLFAYAYLENQEEAKDAVQEVFINVWEQKIGFENKNIAKSYLYTSVKNKCLDTLKSKRFKIIDKNVSLESIKILDSDAFFFKEVVIIETSKIIEEAINTLPARCSQIISLSLKDYSNKEIADMLSLSINTVKTQKKIAYQKLRPLLKNYYFILVFLINS